MENLKEKRKKEKRKRKKKSRKISSVECKCLSFCYFLNHFLFWEKAQVWSGFGDIVWRYFLQRILPISVALRICSKEEIIYLEMRHQGWRFSARVHRRRWSMWHELRYFFMQSVYGFVCPPLLQCPVESWPYSAILVIIPHPAEVSGLMLLRYL